jgi:hypothetical protein
MYCGSIFGCRSVRRHLGRPDDTSAMGRAHTVRSFSRRLEHEPHVQLDQASGTSCTDISEVTFGVRLAVVDDTGSVAQKRATAVVHGTPLCVIEGVKRIRADLYLLALAEGLKRLLQSHIPIVDSGLANVIAMFVTTSHREVCDALVEVEGIGAGGRLRVAVGVESAGKAPAAARKIAIAGLKRNISHAVV